MIQISEYARLSSDIYSLHGKVAGLTIGKISTSDLSKSSSFLEPGVDWYRLIDVETSMTPAHDCYAQLYVKFTNKIMSDAVIAVRGTVFEKLGNDLDDIHAFGSDVAGSGNADHVSPYTNDVLFFHAACVSYLLQYFSFKDPIHFTGHSLGGAVAQLVILMNPLDVPVFSFNSPGCGHVPGVDASKAASIYNINVRYDFISKIGLTLGHLQLVDVPDQENLAKQFFDNFDATAYVKSQQDFSAAAQAPDHLDRLADDLKGLGYRFYSYLATLDHATAATNTAEQKDALQKTGVVSDVIDFWTHAQQAIANQSMDLKNFIAALTAQHSIDNLITALRLTA